MEVSAFNSAKERNMNFGLAVKFAAVAAALGASVAASATPTNFSFAGTFGDDDDVVQINFTANAPSSVTFRSFGYAGGPQASGNVVVAGGFDPILSLFANGNFLELNDDASAVSCPSVSVPSDPVLGGNIFDSCFVRMLQAGSYTVALTQAGNFPVGSTLADGFSRRNEPNFTVQFCPLNQFQFCDVTGNSRTGNWAFDILGVEQATPNNVPEPSALALVGLALAGLGLRARARSA
jgi:PEP-CTERM motif